MIRIRAGFLLLLLCILTIFSCKEKDSKRIHKSTKIISVCDHPDCADATVIQLTDQHFPPDYKLFNEDSRMYSAAYAEYLGFLYNIPLHVFEQEVKGDEFIDYLKTGRGGASIYYPSCFHEYDEKKFESIRNEIGEVYGKTVTTMAYGCGKAGYADSLPNYILGARNSSTTPATSRKNGVTWYGKDLGWGTMNKMNSASQRRNRTATGRYYSDIQRGKLSSLEASSYVKEQVQLTMQNNGLYTNFMHWQDYYPNANGDTIEGMKVIDSLFIAMREGIGAHTTAKVDYNEAIEYLYARESVRSASIIIFDNEEVELQISTEKEWPIDYNEIDTPITLAIPKNSFVSLKFQQIKTSEQIISAHEEDSIVYLDVRIDFNVPRTIIPLEFGAERTISPRFAPIRMNYDGDHGISASIEGKFVLFRRPKEGAPHEISIVDRTDEFELNYDLPSLEEGYDYFCGGITKDGESSLIAIEKI